MIEIKPTTRCLYRSVYVMPEKEISESKMDPDMLMQIAKDEVVIKFAKLIIERHDVKVKDTHDYGAESKVFSLTVYIFSPEEIQDLIQDIRKRTIEIYKHGKHL